jgi:glycolate oxidase FAD binding subunit
LSEPGEADQTPLGDGRMAVATDRPETFEALQAVVLERSLQGHALYPQGGRTALDYGGTPRAAGVAIDTRALDRVIDYPSADMTITVEAGITLGRLRTVLAEKRQRLLVDAPRADEATLGGIFATNTTGSRRLGAGRPRDQIIGVSFVTSDGARVKGGGRVVKNVAGYDFPKLLTGSMGTLGILTQMTLKVRPIPDASALVWAGFDDSDKVASALDLLNTSGTRPIALDVLNRSGARLIGEPLGLPASAWVVVVGFEDNAPSVEWQLERIRAEHCLSDPAIVRDEQAEPLWSALTEFPAAEVGSFSIVAALRPSMVASFAGLLDAERWAILTHAGNGIVRAHALGTIELDEATPTLKRLREFAAAQGGSVILPRCPTAWKEPLRVWGDPRSDWEIAERVKRALDPKGLMNPGRFVGTI